MKSTDWDLEIEVIPENREQIQSAIDKVQKTVNYARISADNVFENVDERRKQYAKISQDSLEGASFTFDCNASDILAKRKAESTQFTVTIVEGRWVLHNVIRAQMCNSKDRVRTILSLAARKEYLEALTQESKNK